MIKNSFKIIPLIFILLLVYKLTSSTYAQTMSNANYIIKMGNLNSGAGEPKGPNYIVSFTLGQTGANLFTGPNYKVRAGFQYIYSIKTFQFKITYLFIDFGALTPGNPVTRASVLTVTNGSGHGYQVTVSQNHNLRVNGTGQEIPPTACDSGNTCTTSTANLWQTTIAYGFGYRCDNVSGTDCDPQFLPPTYQYYYRPFISSPSAIMVMSSANVGVNRQTTITYKLNVSNTQAAGLYTNILNYIATPTY